MIRILIIEDEILAAQRLEKLLTENFPDIEIIGRLDSVETSIEWFRNNAHPDLVLLDIQLADGTSFEIFQKVELQSFVIFTTAYDEYALKAFELNSIDYLLKPVKEEALKKSFDKFIQISKTGNKADFAINDVIEYMASKKSNYKKRFVINISNSIKIIETTDVAYVFSLDKATFLCNFEGKHYAVDFSLDNLEKLLDPDIFFRINRQFIISFESIKKINVLSKSRIKLELMPKYEEDILVSSTKSHEFRIWLDK